MKFIINDSKEEVPVVLKFERDDDGDVCIMANGRRIAYFNGHGIFVLRRDMPDDCGLPLDEFGQIKIDRIRS